MRRGARLRVSEQAFRSGDRGKDQLGEGKERANCGGSFLAQSLPLDPKTRTSPPVRLPGLSMEHQTPERFQRQIFQAGFLVKTRH